jgi:hypothetical protein
VINVLLLVPQVMTFLINVLLKIPSTSEITIAKRLVSLALLMPDMVPLAGHVLLLCLDVRGHGVLVGARVGASLVGRIGIVRRRRGHKRRYGKNDGRSEQHPKFATSL